MSPIASVFSALAPHSAPREGASEANCNSAELASDFVRRIPDMNRTKQNHSLPFLPAATLG